MLNFSEFQEYIRMNFSEIFEKEKINVELSLNSVTKNNGTEFHALTIRTEGSNIAANIYLDDSYERYVEGTTSICMHCGKCDLICYRAKRNAKGRDGHSRLYESRSR